MAKKKIRVEQSFYDTDRFYSILSALGKKDATDKEIAAALNITPETFSRMKTGLIRKTKKGVSEYVKCCHAHAQASSLPSRIPILSWLLVMPSQPRHVMCRQGVCATDRTGNALRVVALAT